MEPSGASCGAARMIDSIRLFRSTSDESSSMSSFSSSGHSREALLSGDGVRVGEEERGSPLKSLPESTSSSRSAYLTHPSAQRQSSTDRICLLLTIIGSPNCFDLRWRRRQVSSSCCSSGESSRQPSGSTSCDLLIAVQMGLTDSQTSFPLHLHSCPQATTHHGQRHHRLNSKLSFLGSTLSSYITQNVSQCFNAFHSLSIFA